jgi:hypothetical protein
LPAGNYVLSLDGATEPGANAVKTRPLTVTLSGAATLNQTVTTNEPDDIGYTLFQFDFASTGGAVDLTFTPNDYTPIPNFTLDNVSVTATPEPSHMLPLALGMLGLLKAALRRKLRFT